MTRLEAALRGQLEPTWHLMWQAIDQVPHPRRHRRHPQPKRDSAVAAAMRLNQLERHQAEYDAQRAFDGPLVMAEYRLVTPAPDRSARPKKPVGAWELKLPNTEEVNFRIGRPDPTT